MHASEHLPIKGPNVPTQGPVTTTTVSNDSADHNDSVPDHETGASGRSRPSNATNGSDSQKVPAARSAASQDGPSTSDAAGASDNSQPATRAAAAEGGLSRWRRKRLHLKPSWLEMDHVLKLATPAAKWPDYAKVGDLHFSSSRPRHTCLQALAGTCMSNTVAQA